MEQTEGSSRRATLRTLREHVHAGTCTCFVDRLSCATQELNSAIICSQHHNTRLLVQNNHLVIMARITMLALLPLAADAFTPATRHTTRVASRHAEVVLLCEYSPPRPRHPIFAPLFRIGLPLPPILPQASVLAEDTKDSDSVMVLEVLPLAGSPT